MKGATIGQNCSIGQNVVVGSAAVIGNGVKIQNNVSIYDAVTIEDGVFCGPSMVFTNVMNPRSEIVRKNEYRPTLIRRGATLGANRRSSAATPSDGTPSSRPGPSSRATCPTSRSWPACPPGSSVGCAVVPGRNSSSTPPARPSAPACGASYRLEDWQSTVMSKT